MIRVLIADDSALMRKMLRQILEADVDIEIVSVARDGEDAVIKAREFQPDVVTMDVNMPRQDGITALQYIVMEKICPVVMVSSLTQEGALTTFEALELGAFDYVAKPGGTVSSNLMEVADELVYKVKTAALLKKRGNVTERLARAGYPAASAPSTSTRSVYKGQKQWPGTYRWSRHLRVLPRIRDINAAFFLVQHMPPTSPPAMFNACRRPAQ